MDTIFVRKCHRGNGHGLQMLKDFVNSFKQDSIGLKYPLSPAMYKGNDYNQSNFILLFVSGVVSFLTYSMHLSKFLVIVCKRYLSLYPENTELLWEINGVGSPFPRTQIARKLQAVDVKGNKVLKFNSGIQAIFVSSVKFCWCLDRRSACRWEIEFWYRRQWYPNGRQYCTWTGDYDGVHRDHGMWLVIFMNSNTETFAIEPYRIILMWNCEIFSLLCFRKRLSGLKGKEKASILRKFFLVVMKLSLCLTVKIFAHLLYQSASRSVRFDLFEHQVALYNLKSCL